MNNITIESKILIDGEACVEIDGKKTTTLRSFFDAISEAMHFPDYFGFNLDSLDELLNDLSWIEDKKLLVYIYNSDSFLINERSESKKLTLLDMLDAICEDWKWFEKDSFDEDEIQKKELRFAFNASDNINNLLNNNH